MKIEINSNSDGAILVQQSDQLLTFLAERNKNNFQIIKFSVFSGVQLWTPRCPGMIEYCLHTSMRL